MDYKRKKTHPGLGASKIRKSTRGDEGWSLAEAYQAFRDGKQALGVSTNTLAHYDKSWGLFMKYARSTGLEYLNDLASRHLDSFFVALDCGPNSPIQKRGGGPFAPDNKANIGVDLKALINWLLTQKEKGLPVLRDNPLIGASIPKRTEKILPPYTDDELQALVKACDGSDPLRIRDRALLFFLLDSATRREEAQMLRIGHIDLDQGQATILDGKGGKTRTTVFDNLTTRAMRKYLTLDFMSNMEPNEPLWWGKYGPLTYEGLGEVIEHIGERAKVHGSCHMLRRTAAIKMLRAGANLEDVRKLLGHSDYQVVRKYLAYVTDDLKRAHTKFSPVNSLECAKPKQTGLAKKRRKKSAPQGFGRKIA